MNKIGRIETVGEVQCVQGMERVPGLCWVVWGSKCLFEDVHGWEKNDLAEIKARKRFRKERRQ